MAPSACPKNVRIRSGIFFPVTHFCERSGEPNGIKDRVVPESMRPLWRVPYGTLCMPEKCPDPIWHLFPRYSFLRTFGGTQRDKRPGRTRIHATPLARSLWHPLHARKMSGSDLASFSPLLISANVRGNPTG